MTKALLMLGAAFVAAGVTISTTAAEARGLRFGLGVGVGLGLGLGAAGALRQRRYEPSYRYRSEPRYVSPSPRYVQPQPYKAARPTPTAPLATPTVRYADNMGRVYDPASGIWHDGQNSCWAGNAAWTFKSGSWFYGSNRWYPSNGSWLTNASEHPAPIDCKASPAFAAKTAVQKEPGGYADQGEPTDPGRAPVASVKVEPAKPQSTNAGGGTCKKYFPNLGESLPVPCTF
ncbi:MAG: hypothetical protein ACAH24_00120 [Hyphomicrobiaceae bacterium]